MPEDFKIPFRRINHVTVAVPAGEHARVRAFYGDILGLKEISNPKALNSTYDLLWFEWLDIQIHIDFTPPWFKPAENRHIAFEITGLPQVRHYLESKGATIREAVPMPDRDRFYVLDPFGNYFEFLELK